MATATESEPALKIGPADRGRRVTLDQFIAADFQEGWRYELARGVISVTEVPGLNHGRFVFRLAKMFMQYETAHPGAINYQAGGGECRLRLPGMQSDRLPDQAVYLLPPPKEHSPWMTWVPQLVVEVVSVGGEDRDRVEKREEYLRGGILEYWILDPKARTLTVLQRVFDVWSDQVIPDDGVHRPYLLPGLEVRPGELLGPPED